MRKDFYVVTPCHSTARPGSIMEGTRLTIQVSLLPSLSSFALPPLLAMFLMFLFLKLANPEGYEYSIRTPGTPPRWVEYNEEMTHVWEGLTEEATAANPDMEKYALPLSLFLSPSLSSSLIFSSPSLRFLLLCHSLPSSSSRVVRSTHRTSHCFECS